MALETARNFPNDQPYALRLHSLAYSEREYLPVERHRAGRCHNRYAEDLPHPLPPGRDGIRDDIVGLQVAEFIEVFRCNTSSVVRINSHDSSCNCSGRCFMSAKKALRKAETAPAALNSGSERGGRVVDNLVPDAASSEPTAASDSRARSMEG